MLAIAYTRGDLFASKNKKKMRIVIGIIILVIISDIIGWPIERVSITGAKMAYIPIYKDYYLMTKDKKALLNLGTGTPWNKVVYFLPFQRGRMREKIKEDVINYLEKLIEVYGDIFYKYEITDDFDRVYIYEVASGVDSDLCYKLETKVNSDIGSLIGLYLEVKGHTKDYGRIVNFVKPND